VPACALLGREERGAGNRFVAALRGRADLGGECVLKTLRHMVWDALPPVAPGMLRADLLVALAEAGRQSDSTRLTEAFSDLRAENSLRYDGKLPARYWRGPAEPAPAGQVDAFSWSPETLQLLLAGWASGKSTAEIGRDVGCSKNIVVGKARRLKLPPRPSPIRASGEKSAYPTTNKPTLPPLRSERAPRGFELALLVAKRPPEPPVMMLPSPPLAEPPRSRVPLPPSLPKPRVKPGSDEPYTWDRRGSKCQWVTVEKPRVRMCSADTPFGHVWCSQHRMVCFNRSHAARSEAE